MEENKNSLLLRGIFLLFFYIPLKYFLCFFYNMIFLLIKVVSISSISCVGEENEIYCKIKNGEIEHQTDHTTNEKRRWTDFFEL